MSDKPRMHHAVGSSFHLPMRFLTPAKRRAMHILYAFCREADDAVDDAKSPTEARARLMALRTMIHNVYTSSSNEEVMLREVVQTYHLKRDYFEAILDGMEMDAAGQMVAPDLSALTLYCYRVAGCVGLLSIAIFGAQGQEAENFAVALGHALQLTNILRDVDEDAERGRLYLPREWLKEEGVESFEPAAMGQHSEVLQRVCHKLALKVQEYFSQAERLSRTCNRRLLVPALLMRDVYHVYLHSMLSKHYDYKAPSARLGFWQKLSIALRALRYYM